MTKKEISFFMTVYFLLIVFVPAFANEKVIKLGGEHGWDSFSTQENIQKGSGRFGYESIRIASASTKLSNTTDMLLSFENDSLSDLSNNYNVVSSSLTVNDFAIMGDYSALSRGIDGGLKLQGKDTSIFGKSGDVGSFSISFWLNPSLAENGETVLEWRTSRKIDYKLIYQMIAGAFYNNKIEWTFKNIFSNHQNPESSFVFSSTDIVIPNAWSYHVINFNEETGLLEYYINGHIQNLMYVTSTGFEQGAVYQAILGTPAPVEICPQFTGLIDDFCIEKKIIEPQIHKPMVAMNGGSFETKPLGPFNANSKITRIESLMTVPNQTEIQLFIRGAENCFGWTESDPEWILVDDGIPIKDVYGSYFQLGARLYTDGYGTLSPLLTSINILYKETEPPLPPFNIFGEAGDGSVKLSWLSSVDENVDGYLLYYGTSMGEYMGQKAIEGNSPIDVGKIIEYKLTGLTNGKIYYFAVSSYTNATPQSRVEGVFSKEIWIRPQRNMP